MPMTHSLPSARLDFIFIFFFIARQPFTPFPFCACLFVCLSGCPFTVLCSPRRRVSCHMQMRGERERVTGGLDCVQEAVNMTSKCVTLSGLGS